MNRTVRLLLLGEASILVALAWGLVLAARAPAGGPGRPAALGR